MDKGVYGAGKMSTESRWGLINFFFLLIVTFSNRIESRGRTEGERGVLSEKILRDFCKEGSTKEGEVAGLRGGEPNGGGPEMARGGKYASENRGKEALPITGLKLEVEVNGSATEEAGWTSSIGGEDS